MRILSYIKISLRTLFLHRSFSLLTLVGLSVGIAMSIFVLEYVFYQFSYDKHYKDSDEIYRMVSEGYLGDDPVQAALSPMKLAQTLKEYSSGGEATRVIDASGKPVKSEFSKTYEKRIIYADSSFFQIFSRPFVEGNPERCLMDSSCVAISQSAAERLFGDRNPIGEKLRFEDEDEFEVKAVYSDVPGNSHFSYDFVLPFSLVEKRLKENYGDEYQEIADSWFSLVTYVYFRSGENENIDKLQTQLNDGIAPAMENEAGELFSEQSRASLQFRFQHLEDIYLFSDYDFEIGKTANPLYVFIFLGVALFILMVTAFNFMNLTTARALDRAKEAGTRRVFGADKRHLVMQFMTESVLFSLVALFLGLVMVELLLPVFNNLFRMDFFDEGYREHLDLPWVLGVTLFVGVSSGLYPAFVFSRIKGIHLQRGYNKFSSSPGLWLRGMLVLIQVFVAVVVTTTAIGMGRQLNFVENVDAGYDPSELLLVERAYYLGSTTDSMIDEIDQIDGVRNVSKLFHTPGEPVSVMSFYFSEKQERMFMLSVYQIDCTYFETMKADIKTGHYVCEDSGTVLINEKAFELLGNDSVVGKKLQTISRRPGDVIDLEITGVVEDIHHGSFKQPLRPAIYVPVDEGSVPQNLLIRMSQGAQDSVTEQVGEIWNNAGTGAPFTVKSMKEHVESYYDEDHRYSSLASAFALLILIISSLGMTGMVSFLLATHQRDMLLRKINGVPDVHNLLSRFKGFFLFVFFGALLALPVSQYLLQAWSATFSLHYQLDYMCFLIPVLLVFFISGSIVFLSGKRVLDRISLHQF
ncbi:MAG: FtsX-like permease family protein [Marinilabilia sp.]